MLPLGIPEITIRNCSCPNKFELLKNLVICCMRQFVYHATVGDSVQEILFAEAISDVWVVYWGVTVIGAFVYFDLKAINHSNRYKLPGWVSRQEIGFMGRILEERWLSAQKDEPTPETHLFYGRPFVERREVVPANVLAYYRKTVAEGPLLDVFLKKDGGYIGQGIYTSDNLTVQLTAWGMTWADVHVYR